MNTAQDVIVVGGGLGGLLTAAILARNGLKVTVLEKNGRIGGGLQMFRRGDVEFPTGMHVFGGFVNGGIMNCILQYLGVNDDLGIVHTDADCIDELFMADGRRFALPRGRERYVDYLSSLFPHERDGIKAYVDAMYALADTEISLWNGRSSAVLVDNQQYLWPADKLISHYVNDRNIRALLSYLAPLYAGISGETPAYEHAMVNVLHIDGSSLFANGSQRLADLLARVVTDAGGSVLEGKEVSAIEVHDRMALNVTTSDGSCFAARQFVSAIDPQQLVKMVSPKAFPPSFRDRVNEASYSYSAFKLFVRLKSGIFPHVSHPRYFFNDNNAEGLWNAAEVPLSLWPLCAMAVSSSDARGMARTLTVVAPVSFDWFARWQDSSVGHRPEDYYLFKKSLEQRVLDLLKRSFPDLDNSILDFFSSSPLTLRDYNGICRGSMYGFHKDCNHFLYTKLSVVTKVKNLFLTGQCVNMHGMCGVAFSSVLTAEALLGHEIPLRKYMG